MAQRVKIQHPSLAEQYLFLALVIILLIGSAILIYHQVHGSLMHVQSGTAP